MFTLLPFPEDFWVHVRNRRGTPGERERQQQQQQKLPSLNTCYVPGMGELFSGHLVFGTPLWGKDCYYPHWTKEEANREF